MRTTATLHFDERGELRQLAVEVFDDQLERLAIIVPPPLGPFDDPEVVYVTAWERAVNAARRQLPDQLSLTAEAHPRVLLRRAVDPVDVSFSGSTDRP